jgi:hypothetical protein
MRALKIISAVAAGAFFIAAAARTQQRQISDSEYIAQALSAAPAAVAKGGTVIRMENGSMRTLRVGDNGFTCMIAGTDKMCNDRNSTAFLDALMKHVPPPDQVGISYMLAGDEGASNTDPYAAPDSLQFQKTK